MKTKRKLKGMTLMEVVVSLAVYAVIGLLIAEIMTLVNATMKATNQLNRRLSYEAKFADNFLFEFVFEIKDIVFHAKAVCHGAGIRHVINRTARLGRGHARSLVIIELHRRADAFVARLLHQVGRHTAVHTAAHGDQGFTHVGSSYQSGG